jgi:hypothetical protein
VVVERARSRVDLDEDAGVHRLGEEVEGDVGVLECAARFRRELDAHADSRPDDGERASTWAGGRRQTRTSTQQGPIETCACW